MSKLKRIEDLFFGRHFDREVFILCVRRYLRFKLSFRDLVELMLASVTDGMSTPPCATSQAGSECEQQLRKQ